MPWSGWKAPVCRLHCTVRRGGSWTAHGDNGYVRIRDYATGRALVETESDETVRGHLSRLSSAGLITVRRNAAIHIYRHGWENERGAAADDDAGKSARNRAKSRGIA